jgi:hypothetical protein
MNFDEHAQTRGRPPIRIPPPANFIKWRDEWRAEVESRRGGTNHKGVAKPKPKVSPRPARPERTDPANSRPPSSATNSAASTGAGSSPDNWPTRWRQDRRKGRHPPLIGRFAEAAPRRSPSQGPGRVPFDRRIGNSWMSAGPKTTSIRPLTPSAIKPDLIVDNTGPQPNRPTTTPSLIVTPAVSATSGANCLISLTCVAVSARSVAGGCR